MQHLDNRNNSILESSFFWLGLIITFCTAYLSFSYNYWLPNKMFWDENYHIASAYKYLNGAFFMEQHPPLGKLLIALAEKTYNKNELLNTAKFLEVDHIKETPDGFSFKAVRLPSVTFSILSACIFYLIFFNIFKNGILALLTNTLFYLDNAILVHSRAAMLEGPQLFAILIALYTVTRVILDQKINTLNWILFSIAFGFAISIKLNSSILSLFIIYLFIAEYKQTSFLKAFAKSTLPFLLAAIFLFCSYYLHFRMSRQIIKKDYEISQSYKEILLKNETSVASFINTLPDFYDFIDRYNSGVPRLKEDSLKENGSHPIFWPLGKKSISYRWDKTSDGKVKHLKLQCNPIGWLIALISIAISFSVISAHRIYKVTFEDKVTYILLEALTLSYIAYMLVMFNMGRVMYLYHYFVPLTFCFINSALLLRLKYGKLFNSKIFIISIFLLATSQTLSFFYFSPFTYHLPISAAEFQNRSWLSIWRNELILW